MAIAVEKGIINFVLFKEYTTFLVYFQLETLEAVSHHLHVFIELCRVSLKGYTFMIHSKQVCGGE